jgi:hypothetical protein
LELTEGGSREVTVSYKRPAEASAETNGPVRTQSGAPLDTGVKASSSTRTMGYVAGGVGIASLVTAGVFIGLRQKTLSDLDARCSGKVCPPGSQSTIDRGRLYTGIAEGTVAFGVVGLAVGAALLFSSPNLASKTGVVRELRVAGAPGALFLTGQY